MLTQNRDTGTEAPFHASGLDLPRLACTPDDETSTVRIEAVADAEDKMELQRLDSLWINLTGKIRINEKEMQKIAYNGESFI